jgi:acyl dehydratase
MPPTPLEDPKGRPKVPFEEIKAGDAVGPFEYELTETLVDRHRRATEQAPYSDARLAPVSLLAADGVQLADQFFDISQSVHAGQRVEVVRIPLMGERLRVTGQAREKFVKRGRRYVVTDTVTTGDGGANDVVARGTTTGVLVYAEGDESAAGSEPKPPPEEPPSVLEHFGPLVRTMTLEKMRLYEAPDEVSIHTDDDFARAAGLPAAIATGTQFMAYLFDLLYRTYGMGSVVGTELDVRIRLPVVAGDQVEASADLVSREGGRLEHVVRSLVERGDAFVGRAWVPAK